jgi:hypothetical protein
MNAKYLKLSYTINLLLKFDYDIMYIGEIDIIFSLCVAYLGIFQLFQLNIRWSSLYLMYKLMQVHLYTLKWAHFIFEAEIPPSLMSERLVTWSLINLLQNHYRDMRRGSPLSSERALSTVSSAWSCLWYLLSWGKNWVSSLEEILVTTL